MADRKKTPKSEEHCESLLMRMSTDICNIIQIAVENLPTRARSMEGGMRGLMGGFETT